MCVSKAEISIHNLKNNIKEIRSRIGKGTRFCAVLKADAYGHGAKELTRIIAGQGLADMLAIGKVNELAGILGSSGDLPVIVLGYSSVSEVEKYVQPSWLDRVILSAYHIEFLRKLQKYAQAQNQQVRAHIRIDIKNSGMGFSIEDFNRYQEEILSYANIKAEGLYTHFYSSYWQDKRELEKELQLFHHFVCALEQKVRNHFIIHAENSPLLFQYPAYQYDMVRSGTAMYGLPFDEKNYNLHPLIKLKGKVFSVNEVDGTVSYKETTGKSVKKIARIMFGYWDCPFLMTQQNVMVKIRGNLYPVLGEACMENLCVDITGNTDIIPGDEAVFLGEDRIEICDVLKRTGVDLVHSEYFCMMSNRLPKNYIE